MNTERGAVVVQALDDFLVLTRDFPGVASHDSDGVVLLPQLFDHPLELCVWLKLDVGWGRVHLGVRYFKIVPQVRVVARLDRCRGLRVLVVGTPCER